MPKVIIRSKDVSIKEAQKMFRDAVKQATPEVVLDELLQELEQFEKKFSMSTVEFYHQYRIGKMDDSRDVMRWAALYESYMNLIKSPPESANLSRKLGKK